MPEPKKKVDLEALKKKALAFGIPVDDILAELKKQVIEALGPALSKLTVDTDAIALKAANLVKGSLPNVQEMNESAQSDLAKRILTQLQDIDNQAKEGREQLKTEMLNRMLVLETKNADTAKRLEEALPAVVNTIVESSFQQNIDAITSQVTAQLQERMKSAGTPAVGGTGSLISSLLSEANLPSLLEIIKLFRAPTADKELGQIFSTFITGMNFGTKIKSGQLTPEDLRSIPGMMNEEKGTTGK